MDTGPELFIGLVGAVGTDLKRVGELLEQELRQVNFGCSLVRLSDLLLDCFEFRDLRSRVGGPEDERIEAMMGAGDRLRRTAARGDAVALLAMGKIRQIRQDCGDQRRSLERHAFLLNSLKHPAEVQTLREVYGGAFVAIAVYTPRSRRNKVLRERIARSRQNYRSEEYEATAEKLINTDEKEPGDDLGQNVRDSFPEADIFLDATDGDKLPQQVKRLIEILFSHPHRTPTVDEHGLFHAKASALRSADLSRQVGAVIMTDDGEIIAAGCNEVPKAGGGAVWEGRNEDRKLDQRDFVLGHDSSARMKHEILQEVFNRLRESKWLRDDLNAMEPSVLVDKALFTDNNPVLAGTRVTSIIEFGRIVHAEMSAISDAARRGLSVKGATLYCTTFPCHMCARHIIAAGIKRVVYIEPYPKSMAKDLYRGSLDVDDDSEADENAVAFRPFVGISPRRYIEFFEMPLRKDTRGYILEWLPTNAMPRIKQYPTYLDVEAVHVDQLSEHRTDWGLSDTPTATGGE